MLELAGIIILGILAQWVAWKFKIPAILPLILIGLLVGPIAAEFLSEDGTKWIERTRLANERTLLSYVRSSLYLLLGAIALFELKEFSNFQYLALTAIIFSILFFIIGIYRFTLLKKSLKRVYYKSEEKDPNAVES